MANNYNKYAGTPPLPHSTQRAGYAYSKAMQAIELLSLASVPYRECWELQRQRVEMCRKGGPGTVIFVEHPPVITLGRAGRRGSLLASETELKVRGIDLVHSNRGGDVTCHAPGQLVVYPILNLSLWKRDVHGYLRALEEVALRTLSDVGIRGHRSPLGSGIWADHPRLGACKIASVGVHLSRWITSHGLALNVCNSLKPFQWIIPCGLQGVKVTSVSDLLGHPITRAAVEGPFQRHLMKAFDLEVKMEVKRRHPDWLKVKIPGGEKYNELKSLMRGLTLHTVCEDARCPNIGECWGRGVATFMILGDICTRACRYCAVASGRPRGLDLHEPAKVAQAVTAMELRHVVVTSVDRDDLQDGGSGIFAATIAEIRKQAHGCAVEVLIPDFRGDDAALRTVVEAGPEILGHNVETVPRLYRLARSGGNYRRSITLLQKAKQWRPGMITKTGMMLGLGETVEEVTEVMRDLAGIGVSILTLGQYLQPTCNHLPVVRHYHPDEFREMKILGESLGLGHVEAGPLVRSSYRADRQFQSTLATGLP
ncbi:MAG: lipoyl synthase [Acidobacteria bacterium]|nr:lipoyl synthase [Acidobacteriota bacterium]